MYPANTSYRAADENNSVVEWSHLPDASRLYYEAHVTVPPLTRHQEAEIDLLAAQQGWRRSTFELHKDGVVPNAFVSTRNASRSAILQNTAEMVRALLERGYTVLRWKVEDTLLDSNRGDRLLPESPDS